VMGMGLIYQQWREWEGIDGDGGDLKQARAGAVAGRGRAGRAEGNDGEKAAAAGRRRRLAGRRGGWGWWVVAVWCPLFSLPLYLSSLF
jgi:hypothetical protein